MDVFVLQMRDRTLNNDSAHLDDDNENIHNVRIWDSSYRAHSFIGLRADRATSDGRKTFPPLSC